MLLAVAERPIEVRVDGIVPDAPERVWFLQIHGQQWRLATHREDLQLSQANQQQRVAEDTGADHAAIALLGQLAGDGRLRIPAREWIKL